MIAKEKKSNKYQNAITEYNGAKYHSAKEAKYAEGLDWRLKGKDIASWRKQVRMPVIVNGQKICDYILDFEITHNDGRKEYVDVKGYKQGLAYNHFKLKKKLIKAVHNIDIIEA